MMKNDINFNDPNCTHTLASGLSHYSNEFGFEHSKKWALDWIKDAMPAEYERLKNAKDTLFSNRGFVCRMIKNGLKVSPEQTLKLVEFFRGINTDPKPVEKAEEPRNKKAVSQVNQIIFQLEDVVDAILSDGEPSTVTVPVDPKQIKEAQAWIEKEAIEAAEQISKHQAILAQLESVYERCGGIKSKLVKPAAKPAAKAKPDHADKAKAVKTMTYQKEDTELKVTSLSPAKLVGAKKALLYNTKHRTVCVYAAKPGQTLSVSGSSIRGADESKSYSKVVRKPAEFFAVANRMAAAELLNSKPRNVGMHVSDTMLIVEVA